MLNEDTLKTRLIDNWQELADQFVFNYTKDDIYFWTDELSQTGLNNVRIRNCIYRSNLRRNYSDCTKEEIAEDKLNGLMQLIKKRPELEQLIQSKL